MTRWTGPRWPEMALPTAVRVVVAEPRARCLRGHWHAASEPCWCAEMDDDEYRAWDQARDDEMIDRAEAREEEDP